MLLSYCYDSQSSVSLCSMISNWSGYFLYYLQFFFDYSNHYWFPKPNLCLPMSMIFSLPLSFSEITQGILNFLDTVYDVVLHSDHHYCRVDGRRSFCLFLWMTDSPMSICFLYMITVDVTWGRFYSTMEILVDQIFGNRR